MVTTAEALIQKSPNLMGGEACIRRTRIAVWNIVVVWRLGFSDHELLTHFVSPITREDLAAARNYYALNKEEIDVAISENEEA